MKSTSPVIVIGAVIALAIVALLLFDLPDPDWLYMLVVSAATLLGAWIEVRRNREVNHSDIVEIQGSLTLLEKLKLDREELMEHEVRIRLLEQNVYGNAGEDPEPGEPGDETHEI